MQQIDGVVAALAADVHMLAKDRRLLRQIAKMLDGFDIARVIADLLALPGMKGWEPRRRSADDGAAPRAGPPAGWR